MDRGSKFLSDLVLNRTYAAVKEDGRKETRDEVIDRVLDHHSSKFPELADELKRRVEGPLKKGQIVPAMRWMQFAGEGIRRNEVRGFNCFGQETEFVTSEGVKSFADYHDGDIITARTHKGQWKQAVVRSYGEQQLQQVTYKRGGKGVEHVVRATADHRWIKADGSETTSLQVGDTLYLAQPKNKTEWDDFTWQEKLYWCYGYAAGDGTLAHKERKTQRTMVRLCKRDEQYLERFEELGFESTRPLSCKGDPMVYLGKYTKEYPDPTVDSPELIRAWMVGFLAADGSKDCLGEDFCKSVQQTGQENCDKLRKLLPLAGFYITAEQDYTGQKTNYGVRPHTIRFMIRENFQRGTNSVGKVVDIQPDAKEVVWCLEVEDDKSFVFPTGVATGNCAYTTIETFQDFSEIFYVLMCGTGMGYSVQRHHTNKLPDIPQGEPGRFKIPDDKEGWADSVRVLLENPKVEFDYSGIRPKGAKLSTGGTASGPSALQLLHDRMRTILKDKKQLTPLMVHDIVCCIADGVVVGGVRRAALISLFDPDDNEMLSCKHGSWWESAPWRGRANNSAVINRNSINAGHLFDYVMTACFNSNAGEPGIYWTNHEDWGTNPCCEIALQPKQMCNLTEVNVAACKTYQELTEAVQAAAILGTLQASYTNFTYLDPRWQKNCNEEALLGVSLTGLGEKWELVEHGPSLKFLSHLVGATNKLWADKIGIKASARQTCVKPSGTASAYFGTTSGIHAAHAEYYIRRVRIDTDHPLAAYLARELPEKYIKKDQFNPDNWVVSIPVKMEGAILRDEESPIALMERAKHIAREWVSTGHITGKNAHNVSMTVSYKEEEKEQVLDWMWENRDFYNGISLLPFDESSYVQMPFETIDEKTYRSMLKGFPQLDLSQVNYGSMEDDRQNEAACAGGQCTFGL
jgi:ribonucleoside-triphosphate reductase (thioredoxin)